MSYHPEIATPAVVVNRARMDANITGMQAHCDAHGVELRPHVKTHKMVPVARAQLAAGAKGLTCATLGEAEAMLASGVRSIFLAHSMVDPAQATRIRNLVGRLEDFRVAATSQRQAEALALVAALTGQKLAVMMAIDSGLNREGVRTVEDASRLAAQIARSRSLELRGFYTHEGHFYGVSREQVESRVLDLIQFLHRVRDAVDRSLPLWPGCSVTARLVAAQSPRGVEAVRPGTYVFGDLSLCQTTSTISRTAVALSVLATVIDCPEPGLALIDAGSKTFSSDRTPTGEYGRASDGREIYVARVNEEHGYLRGADVAQLRVGERLFLTPAHVCTVVNLASHVIVTDDNVATTIWPVDARARSHSFIE